jgi:hypothetical protein
MKEVLYNYDLTRDGQSIDPKEISRNYNDLATVIKNMVDFFPVFSDFAIFLTNNILVFFYYRMLFLCVDDYKLKEIDGLLKKSEPVFFKNLNKRLLGTPWLWRLFGIHFLFYEKIKKKLGVDRR